MPTTNGLNQFLVPAQDAFLYQLFYNKVYGGNTGCTVVINGTTVQIGANSSIDIFVETISGGTGCLLSGDRPNVYGGDSNQYKYVPQTFVSVWDTTRTSSGSSTATQVKLPLISTGTYNFIVDWGDGSTDKITTWNQAQTTHTYATAGAYQVVITGTLNGFRFANTGDRLKLLSVFKWGTAFRLGATDSHFYGCANLDLSEVSDVLDLTAVTSFVDIFRGCTRLSLVNNINSWNTSNITSFAGAFKSSPNFNSDIGNWDTSNVTTMEGMFDTADNNIWGTFNQYIGNWNTSKVTNMINMFQQQNKFNQNINTKAVTVNGVTYTAWDVSKVTSMFNMFNVINTNGVFNQDIGNWDTSSLTSLVQTFQRQPNFNQNINTKQVTVNNLTYNAWNVSNVTSIQNMLNCTLLDGSFNQDISNWNTSKIANIRGSFNKQPKFNQDISTKVVTVGGITYIAWDTSNINEMGFAFNCTGADGVFNQNIGNWNTSKVTNMQQLFTGQPNFNQDVSTKVVTVSGSSYVAWDTSNVTNMSYMFYSYTPITTGRISGNFNKDISNWNTSKVTTMVSMFENQPYFNQNVGTKAVTVSGVTYSAWTVSAVTNMDFMFFISNPSISGGIGGSFNNSGSTSINNWDVRRVTTMRDIFNCQTAFNQPINNWIVSGVTAFSSTGATQGTQGFMFGKTENDYSTINYDDLLIGWSARNVRPNQLLNMGTIKYTAAATSARNVLTSAPNNWTIIDGGIVLPFTSIWRTTASNETVTLPYLASGAIYTGIIDWGDGFTSGNTYANRAHTYATPGDYTISINGTISGFCFNNTGDKLKLREITRWGTEFRPNNNYGTFFGCSNLVLTGVTDTLNLAGMTRLDTFFYACSSLTTIKNINSWNLSGITSLNRMFENASNFNDNVGGWNTSNVTDMQNAFTNALKFNNGGSPDINNWNTSKVTTFKWMFAADGTVAPGIAVFNQPIGNWNTSNVQNTSLMFWRNTSFNQDISTKVVTVGSSAYTAWDTSNVTDMSNMIGSSAAAGNGSFNGNISNWNTSKVTNMTTMFQRQPNFNQDISTKFVTVGSSTYTAWDTSNVTNMGFMFSNSAVNGTFNQNIGNWNTSKVTNMTTMFQNQLDFNQDISTKVVTVGSNTYTAWDTSNVNSMSLMFSNGVGYTGKFNQNIGNWNTSKVTTMLQMFQLQPNFNQDISTKVVTVGSNTYTAWDTSNVNNMSFMLYGSFPNSIGEFNQNIGNWNTSKVTTMNNMFTRQPDFNQDISTKVVSVSGVSYVAWDTSNVINMSGMFFNPSGSTGNFNQNIGNWNTNKVTTMSSMLTNQPYFNQDIGTKAVTVSGVTYSAWSVSAVTNMTEMFFITINESSGLFNNSGSTSINNWDVRKVTTMADMFNNQTGFNQPINNWNISGITGFSSSALTSGFMFGKTSNDYSATNYDNLLIGWSARNVRPNQILNMGTIKYTSASTSARSVLTTAPNNWTIIDGGLA